MITKPSRYGSDRPDEQTRARYVQCSKTNWFGKATLQTIATMTMAIATATSITTIITTKTSRWAACSCEGVCVCMYLHKISWAGCCCHLDWMDGEHWEHYSHAQTHIHIPLCARWVYGIRCESIRFMLQTEKIGCW